jgi:hypothetical protein
MVGERRIPGNLDMDIVIDLFLEQSRPWQQMVDLLMKALLNEIKAAIDIILNTITDQQTKSKLWVHLIDPSLERLADVLKVGAREMLQRRLDTETFVHDHSFTNTIQKSRRSSRRVALFRHLHSFFCPDSMPTAGSNCDLQDTDLEALLEKLTLKTRADMDEFDCTEMTDGVQACYKVCSIPFQRSCRASCILLTCKQLA